MQTVASRRRMTDDGAPNSAGANPPFNGIAKKKKEKKMKNEAETAKAKENKKEKPYKKIGRRR